MLASAVATAFTQQFGATPTLLVRAPGRINIIGEHTDYNQGYVLPAAIDKGIYFAVRLNDTGRIRLLAHDLNESVEVPADAVQRRSTQTWANYLLGVVAQLQARGIAVPGFDCAFGGDVPLGAGLSSSAAVECGLAYALNELLHLNIDKMQLAQLAQSAEHEYAGVQCGLMDQFASIFGQAGQVVRLDCRSLEYAYFPFNTQDCRIVLCNSGVKHSLASSEYNTRRQECAQGVAVLQEHYPEVASLRDATVAQLEAHRAEMPAKVFQRCLYVVQENLRVEQACQHLLAGELPQLGQQLYASHEGLSKLYEVSCPELDVLVDIAQAHPGVYGARMMGGGFGGCTINLVRTEQVASFVAHAQQQYERRTGIKLETHETTIVDGVGEVVEL